MQIAKIFLYVETCLSHSITEYIDEIIFNQNIFRLDKWITDSLFHNIFTKMNVDA